MYQSYLFLLVDMSITPSLKDYLLELEYGIFATAIELPRVFACTGSFKSRKP